MFKLDEMRATREAAGISQRQLAPRLGADRTAVQKIEAGRLVPSVALARRIEAELGLEAESVFGSATLCKCACGGSTFSAYLAGHAPKAGGPVAQRKDRVERTPFGSALRTARIGRRLTQGDLAMVVGCKIPAISSIENGHDLPSERLALALAEAVGVPDLFPLEPCPCGCSSRTVGGRYARGHHPLREDGRRKLSASKVDYWNSDNGSARREAMSENWRRGWVEGDAPQRALLAAAKEGKTPIPIPGRTRSKRHGQWNGIKGAAAGIEAGRAKGGRPSVASPEQQQDMLRLNRAGLSTRAIAEHVFGDARYYKRVQRFLNR